MEGPSCFFCANSTFCLAHLLQEFSELPFRSLQFALSLLPHGFRLSYTSPATITFALPMVSFKVLFGSKESFLLVLSALQVVQETRRPLWDIRGVAHDMGARGDPSQGAIAGVFQSVHRYPGTKKARQGMPHHQRGLMRRKCWRCQQHNLVESDGDAVGVVCELPKKMGVDPNHPRHDALPPHQQGRQIHIDQGGSNRRSSKVQTTAGVSDP